MFLETFFMVGRFRERQYQLAAQRHNEEYVKGVDPKGKLAKAKKAERLSLRRNKLRRLLQEEDESYRKELEERKRLKNRVEVPSLEQLKQRLKEKRAEQSLYLPKTCRRYQSYFVCPKVPESSGSSTLRDTNLQYWRVCRDSTNLIRPAGYSRHSSPGMSEGRDTKSQEQQNAEKRQEVLRRSSFSNDLIRPNSRYSARYARRSLENTNVRNDDFTDYGPNKTSSRSSLGLTNDRYSPNSDVPSRRNDKENASRTPESRVTRRTMMNEQELTMNDQAHQKESPQRRYQENDYIDQNESNESMDGAPETPTKEPHHEEPHHEEPHHEEPHHQERDQQDKYNSKADDGVEHDVKKTDNQQFEVEKSMPWLRMDPNDKNLSKQMFLYLTHNELKNKIEDLSVRESHACKKQCWDEALRLRDMRNRLELLREKKLYSIDNLDLDDETKKLGLINIDKRENELAQREDACTDSTMYSEDAKELWKKWVIEDERSVIELAREQREKLMRGLEKEWQNLAIRDKEQITQSYHTVMGGSAIQEAHNLMASKMKAPADSMK